MISSRQQGAVLAMTLLLMMVLTGLVLTALSNTVLTSKISQAWRNQMESFSAAEGSLLVAEANLNGQTLTVSAQGVNITTKVELQDEDVCQRPWYLITVAASYQGANVTLQSAYKLEHVPPLPECVADHFVSQRLWWRQIDV